jgi:hypothetical protein
MATISQTENAACLLLEAVQAEWERDIPFGGWLATEGERVRDNALALVRAARSCTLRTTIGSTTVHGYLGAAWLDVHAKCYEQADALQVLVGSGAA